MPERTQRRVAREVSGRSSASSGGLLAVDVGNSETVVGLFRAEQLSGYWRIISRTLSGDEALFHLDSIRQRAGSFPRGLSGALCSVAPGLTGAWHRALALVTGRPPMEVSVATAKSLTIRYLDKSAVGADRIANAVAARKFYGTPAIVVDLGTATTFDCISSGGAYLGGAIAPGIVTSSEELFRRAARLARVEIRRPPQVLGRTTEQSLQAGVLYGAAGQVDALVRRLALEMKGTPHVIATGGLASVVAPECETINVVDETLTLKGIKVLWEDQR